MSAAIENPDVPPVAGYGTAAEAVATMKLAMPSVVLARADADATWQPEAFPTAYVLDKDHKVVQVIQSAAPEAIATALDANFGVKG